jgi:NodT family efflux transporter outer membrane factor (OMF) lipoprotein
MSEPTLRHAAGYGLPWRPLSALVLLALSACATQQDLQPTVKALPAGQLGLNETQAATAADLPAAWWQALGDERLNRLIDRALADNPSMAVVKTRLQRVHAAEVFARAADKPQIQATGEADRQHFSDNGLYPPPIAGSSRTIGTLQLEGSWELDLFGKQRAEIEAAVGQSRAAQADAQATRLLLSTQVARAHLQLARLLAQREVAQRTLAQREEVLSLIRQRVQAGLDTTVELRQGEGSPPEARQQIEALNEQIGVTRHALAALTGQGPEALQDFAPELRAIKPMPAPSTLPVDLLARRADVNAALWRAQASGHEVVAARALFYPNIDLRSYAGYNAIGLDNLLKPGSLQWGLLPAIHLPLFDADRRRANLQGKIAEQDAAVASYNQTVLQAVQEVADQLGVAQSVARQQQDQRAAQASAEAAYSLAVQRFKAGLGTYLTVLSTESGVLRQRSLGVDLQARLLDTQVSLAKALGGSLEAPSVPSSAAASALASPAVSTSTSAAPPAASAPLSPPAGATVTAPIASPSQTQRVALSGDRS